jgi:hypothetical protein
MICDRYEEFEMDRLEEAVFLEHAHTCEHCRRRLEEDEKLLSLASGMRKHVEAPFLWERIERDLQTEKESSRSASGGRPQFRFVRYLRIAAVLVVTLGLGYYLGIRTRHVDTGLLSSSTLKKVEDREREYAQAISELEKQVEPVMAGMDIELALLYRDRLEIVDSQIERLREALAENPANAHIRQYMYAALQDKKETLKELLGAASHKMEPV